MKTLMGSATPAEPGSVSDSDAAYEGDSPTLGNSPCMRSAETGGILIIHASVSQWTRRGTISLRRLFLRYSQLSGALR